MNSFFDLDSKFVTITNKIVDSFFISILWILFSMPVVTIGASVTAFYYTVHKTLRRNRGYIWRTFLDAFKSNFKQTTKIWILLMAVFVILAADYRILYAALEQGSYLGKIFFLILFFMIILSVWSVYIFAYSARFENSMKDTMKNAAIIAVLNLPWSALVLTILAAGASAVLFAPVLILIVPTGIMCLLDIILEKVFQKYMSDEDLKKERGQV